MIEIQYTKEREPSRWLSIGNISTSVKNKDVRNFFKDCGEIEHISWCIHPSSGEFLNRGFCTFATQEGATKAYKMSGTKFLGQMIYVHYQKIRETVPSRRLLFRNILSSFPVKQFRGFFKDCGKIEDIHWHTDDRSGKTKNSGFCTFATQEGATKAYKMSGKTFSGRMIEIQYTKEREPSRWLSIGNISSWLSISTTSVENEQVRNFFKDCGEIEHISWSTHPSSGEFLNRGFCTFATQEGATKAYKMSGTKFLDRMISIHYQKIRETVPSRRLLFRNILSSVKVKKLRRFFKGCGKIEDIHWHTDDLSGKTKNWGFCTFATQ